MGVHLDVIKIGKPPKVTEFLKMEVKVKLVWCTECSKIKSFKIKASGSMSASQ